MQEIRQDTGYGLIPRSIMRNRNLSLQARAIYSYLASFAGNTGRAWPSVSLMTADLGITKNTFYKYLRELRDAGAVEVQKEATEDGTFGRNIYYLHNEVKQPHTKKEDTAPCTKKPDTAKPDTVKPDTANRDTNSNTFNSNNLKSNKGDKSELKPDDADQLKYPDGSLEVNLAKAMVELILQEKPDSKIPGREAEELQGWATDIDRTLRIDQRDPRELIELFRWAQADDFWVANIRSPRKLREKWDTLQLQKNRRGKKSNIDNLANLYQKELEKEEAQGKGLWD